MLFLYVSKMLFEKRAILNINLRARVNKDVNARLPGNYELVTSFVHNAHAHLALVTLLS